jgi:hypothetical protein
VVKLKTDKAPATPVPFSMASMNGTVARFYNQSHDDTFHFPQQNAIFRPENAHRCIGATAGLRWPGTRVFCRTSASADGAQL